MENYTAELARWFRSHADPVKAAPMAAYMRDKFPFLGIKTPERNQLTRAFWAKHGIPSGDELLEVVRRLWELPEREFQNVAMAFLDKQGKRVRKEDIDTIEHLIITKSWWDTVDYLAAHSIGGLFGEVSRADSGLCRSLDRLGRFLAAPNCDSLSAPLQSRTDVERLFAYVERCKDESEFSSARR